MNFLKTKGKVIAYVLAGLVAAGGVGVGVTNYVSDRAHVAEVQARTVLDLANREVVVPKDLQSVVSIHAEPDAIVARLRPDLQKTRQENAAARIMPIFSEEEQARLKALPLVNAFYKSTSIDTILGVNPDIIMDITKDPSLEKRSAEFGGIPVVALSKDTIPEYIKSWRLAGKVLQTETEANRIADFLQATVDSVTKALPPVEQRPKVWLVTGTNLEVAGPQTMLNEILKVGGGQTYWDSRAFPTTSNPTDENLLIPVEELLAYNPDYVFCINEATKKAVLGDARLQRLKAIQSGRVITTQNYFRLDQSHCVLGVQWLATQLYPEIFGDRAALLNKAVEYYKIVFNVETTADNKLFDVPNK